MLISLHFAGLCFIRVCYTLKYWAVFIWWNGHGTDTYNYKRKKQKKKKIQKRSGHVYGKWKYKASGSFERKVNTGHVLQTGIRYG